MQNKKVEEISWSLFHAERQTQVAPKCTSALPLFFELSSFRGDDDSRHNCYKQSHEVPNPGQTVGIACDQPLFALAKTIQWAQKDSAGDDNLVVMLGGLHIEQAALEAIGWVEVLSQAEINMAGRAESLINCAHITHTRYAHQVTAARLFISTWRSKKAATIPQFKNWIITLQFELLMLTLVRSFRESNFTLYTEALVGIAALMFALDRTNYPRWLPVHIRDMLALQSKHPEIYREFQSGKFTV